MADDINFDDIKLGDDLDDLDSLDLDNFAEVDDNIDVPHMKIATKDFINFLKVAKIQAVISGRDIISKSMALEINKDKVIGRVTDLDTYFEYKMECLNTVNVLDEPVSIPVSLMIKLAKALPVYTIILKREGQLYVKLVGGEIPLEVYNVDFSKYTLNEEVEYVKSVNAQSLYRVIKDFNPLVCAAVQPQEKRIIFTPELAVSSYVYSLLIAKDSWENFDLRIKDINLLKSVLKDVEEDLKIYKSKENASRIVMSSSTMSYTFYISEIQIPSTLVEMSKEFDSKAGMYIDLVQFYKLIEVASELDYSTGKVGITLDNNEVKLAIKTKRNSDAVFKLEGSGMDNAEKYTEEVQLQAKQLRILLRTFASESSIKVKTCSKGVMIESSYYKAVLFTEL